MSRRNRLSTCSRCGREYEGDDACDHSTPVDVAFRTDEQSADEVPVSLDEMLSANAEDADVCAWLRSARPGDVYHGGLIVTCVEVAS